MALDILVHVRETSGESLAAKVALAIARRLPAYLYGIHIAPIGSLVFSTPETAVFQAQEADLLFRNAVARKSWWEQQLQSQAARGEWLAAQGETVEVLCHAARWCDLIVAERPVLNPDAPTGWGTVSRTVFGASRPVVVVPQTAKVDVFGERVLIAWNQSRESTLAIKGALPILKAAAQIVVLEGNPSADRLGARHLPMFDLKAFLTRHGIAAQFHRFAPKNDVGANIVSAARDTNTDSIVMGAWGNSRITELVLGGATRYLFQNSELPLLVAH